MNKRTATAAHPARIIHDGETLYRTGKTGRCVLTGQASAEYEGDIIMWRRADGTISDNILAK
jgi:hypothetical protein